ncbi:hypothetical protein C8F01DRAFT_1286470 [Mycena amicta]|nr:hypothetical protein C8F01DRAFT_1286470 [Mycena amicta]
MPVSLPSSFPSPVVFKPVCAQLPVVPSFTFDSSHPLLARRAATPPLQDANPSPLSSPRPLVKRGHQTIHACALPVHIRKVLIAATCRPLHWRLDNLKVCIGTYGAAVSSQARCLSLQGACCSLSPLLQHQCHGAFFRELPIHPSTDSPILDYLHIQPTRSMRRAHASCINATALSRLDGGLFKIKGFSLQDCLPAVLQRILFFLMILAPFPTLRELSIDVYNVVRQKDYNISLLFSEITKTATLPAGITVFAFTYILSYDGNQPSPPSVDVVSLRDAFVAQYPSLTSLRLDAHDFVVTWARLPGGFIEEYATDDAQEAKIWRADPEEH